MKFIAHRGNIDGRNPSSENKPSYIAAAIELGLDVEVDMWLINNEYMFGHDSPQYNIDLNTLYEWKDKLWIHCKNVEVLTELAYTDFNYFWHDSDSYTLTSHKYIWSYFNVPVHHKNMIANIRDSEAINIDLISNNIYGICIDNFLKIGIINE